MVIKSFSFLLDLFTLGASALHASLVPFRLQNALEPKRKKEKRHKITLYNVPISFFDPVV
jgi:hypothetical protein